MLAREKWQIETLKVLEEVFEERKRQVERYGHNDDKADGTGPRVPWLAPLLETEAVGIEAWLRQDYEEDGGDEEVSWMKLVREEVAESFAESDPEKLQAELLQVAALCVSWVESIRKR